MLPQWPEPNDVIATSQQRRRRMLLSRLFLSERTSEILLRATISTARTGPHVALVVLWRVHLAHFICRGAAFTGLRCDHASFSLADVACVRVAALAYMLQEFPFLAGDGKVCTFGRGSPEAKLFSKVSIGWASAPRLFVALRCVCGRGDVGGV